MMDLCTRSAAETLELGVAIAGVLEIRDVIICSGDLGAGKTVLAKGIASGLGVTESVVSPTFAIAHQYQGRCLLHHIDLYRVESTADLVEIGIDELLNSDAVTVVEWGELLGSHMPEDRLDITLKSATPTETADDVRVVTLRGHGDHWARREAVLRDAVASFEGS